MLDKIKDYVEFMGTLLVAGGAFMGMLIVAILFTPWPWLALMVYFIAGAF